MGWRVALKVRCGTRSATVARALVVAMAASGAFHATSLHAEGPKRACIDANEQAQIAQRAGQLRKAREQLLYCASSTCPAVVRTDCARLLVDVTASLPTVVVDARDASHQETTRGRVYFDDVLVAESLNGLELELDPGAHTVRVDLSGEGRGKEQRLVLKEGEKRRRLVVDFPDTAAEEGPSTGSAAIREPAPVVPVPGAAKRSFTVPLVFGGIAAVAAASFGYFAIVGYSDEKKLASSCAPRCTSSEVTPVWNKYVAADVTLGVAVASLSAAILFAWLGHGRTNSKTTWHLEGGPAGGRVAAAVAW